MTTLEKKKKSFFIGNWNSYDLEEMDPDIVITPSQISKNLSVFNKSFKLDKEIFAIEDLLCMILILEELPKDSSKKSGKNSTKTENDKKKVRIYKFKLALSVSDSILFSSRIIPEMFRDDFETVFTVSSLKLKELSGSPPLQLLMLHRQASDASSVFSVLMNSYSLDCVEESKVPNMNDVFFKIGCSKLPTPHIKKLSCMIENMSFNTKEEGYEDIIMEKVKVELHGQSLLRFYQDLAEQNAISSVPEWIAACRLAGRTHRDISYTD